MVLFNLLDLKSFDWNEELFMSVFTGTFVGLMFTIVHIKNLKAKNIPITDSNIKSRHSRIIVNNISIEDAHSILAHHPNFRYFKITVYPKSITLKSSASAWGIGEIISLDFHDMDENNIQKINISSKPKLFTNILDSGRNYINVEQVKNALLNKV